MFLIKFSHWKPIKLSKTLNNMPITYPKYLYQFIANLMLLITIINIKIILVPVYRTES